MAPLLNLQNHHTWLPDSSIPTLPPSILPQFSFTIFFTLFWKLHFHSHRNQIKFPPAAPAAMDAEMLCPFLLRIHRKGTCFQGFFLKQEKEFVVVYIAILSVVLMKLVL